MIAHETSYNPDRQASEILLRLEDVKPSGIFFVAENNHNNNHNSSATPINASTGGWIHYARPFVDDTSNPRELILEIGSDPTILNLGTKNNNDNNNNNQATFHGLTQQRITALLQVIAGKVDIPITTSPSAKIRFRIDANTALILDGEPADPAMEDATLEGGGTATTSPASKKRKLDDGLEAEVREWKVRTGQWRVRVQAEAGRGGGEIVLVAVKIDAFTCERAKNARRRFLS